MASMFDRITHCFITEYYEENGVVFETGERYSSTTNWNKIKTRCVIFQHTINLPSVRHEYFKKLVNLKNLCIRNPNAYIPKNLYVPKLECLTLCKAKNHFIILNDSMKNLSMFDSPYYKFHPILFIPDYLKKIKFIYTYAVLFENIDKNKDPNNRQITYVGLGMSNKQAQIRYRALINKQIRQRNKFLKMRFSVIYNPNYVGGYNAKKRITREIAKISHNRE